MLKHQINITEYLLQHPSKWHPYSYDPTTVNSICGLVNLGIIAVNTSGYMRLKSQDKARMFVHRMN